MKRIFNVDDDFFEIIDCEEKAYCLGLMYSDGNVLSSKNWDSKQVSLTQAEKDKDVLEQFKKLTKSESTMCESTVKGEKYYRLTIYSKKMFDDLNNLGVVERKSLALTFPDFLPKELIGHFIRGYFDGDGCIWEGKPKKMAVKKENKPGEYRERIVHNVKFTVTGSVPFIKGLQKFLVDNCGFNETKLNFRKAKNENTHCTMEYSGRKNIEKLFNLMYNNSHFFGKRKRDKFEKILNNENYSNI